MDKQNKIPWDEPRIDCKKLDEVCIDCGDFLNHPCVECADCPVSRLKKRIVEHKELLMKKEKNGKERNVG